MINDPTTISAANLFTSASAIWLAGLVITAVGRERVKSKFLAFLMLAGALLTLGGAALSWNQSIEYNPLQ